MVGRPSGSALRGHQPARLVIAEQPRALARAQRLAVDRDAVGRRHVERRRGNHRAVDGDAAVGDPGLRLAARGEAGAGHHLGDALALFVMGCFFGHEHALWHCPHSCNSPWRKPAPPAARGEVPVGCVIVRGGEVVARAGNRTVADKDPTAHAELLAIRQAAAALGTRAACRLRSLCDAGALRHVRGGDVVCPHPAALFRRRRSEGRGGGKRRAVFCAAATCHHRPDVYGGINESECAELLRGFFQARR